MSKDNIKVLLIIYPNVGAPKEEWIPTASLYGRIKSLDKQGKRAAVYTHVNGQRTFVEYTQAYADAVAPD